MTDTVTNTESGIYTVPSGKYGHLESYPLYDVYRFEVYDTLFDYVRGYGEVNRPVGYCYNHYDS
ncbi:hypothetical protein [Kitasatospora phosalacinea]|uniref:hypothetical protein n=1 Tax=Kitasatospora phosalacinea TaxID=2065 RepID=UPI00131BEA7A|nr:hypothetical protein [Kitasatospora phosalacinea]